MPKEARKRDYEKKNRIPWRIIGEIYKHIRFEGEESIIKSLKIPIGWYPLLDYEGEDYTMLVWEDQEDGFSNIIEDKDKLVKNIEINNDDIIKKYFGGFNMPPAVKDMDYFIYNLKMSDTMPVLFRFKERDQIDPREVANMLLDRNVGVADLAVEIGKIYEENKEIIENIYDDYWTYFNRVLDNLDRGDNEASRNAEIVEVPVELLPYKIEATHKLNHLMNEVIEEMFQGNYYGIKSIEWTDRPYTGYYGMFYPGGDIRINKLLDSPEVDREVIKFIIYHEMLHRDYFRHDKDFYREEHKYPNYTEHNRFLDHKIYNHKLQM